MQARKLLTGEFRFVQRGWFRKVQVLQVEFAEVRDGAVTNVEWLDANADEAEFLMKRLTLQRDYYYKGKVDSWLNANIGEVTQNEL